MKKNNIIFLISSIFFIIIIFLINFIGDPYEIKTAQRDAANSSLFQRDKIDLFFKVTKNFKYKQILIGGSSSNGMWNPFIFDKHNTATICENRITFTDIYNLLKSWTNIHPETKIFILPLEHLIFLSNAEASFQEFNETQYNITDFIHLFFSFETTKISIKKLFFNLKLLGSKEKTSYTIKPKIKIPLITSLNKDKQYRDINKIIELIEEKNIKIICFIPPYHAWYLAQIYNSPIKKDIQDLIRYIVKKDVNIHNFATINKYTSKSLFKDNFLYYDVIHPNVIYGDLIFDIILGNEVNQDSDLYEYITKDNVEEMLKLNEKKIENFIKNNKEDVNTFLSYTAGPNLKDWYYTEERILKDISEFEKE